ncbi:MAG: hypothetical protein ACE5JP_01285 [Candidatus Bipolaricaulia bacterium]
MKRAEDIVFYNETGNLTSTSENIDGIPNTCPLCHRAIRPTQFFAFLQPNERLQVTYGCTNEECQRLFIAIYRYVSDPGKGQTWYKFQEVAPVEIEKRGFSKEIESCSEDFTKIYNQAFAAEQLGLDLICGAGYRKALEFLVRDYCVHLNRDNEEEKEKVKSKPLANCIDENIKNKRIKAMAERAWWLGSDEAHYMRLYEENDIEDLKALIEATRSWVETDLITEQYSEEIKKKPKKKS